MSNDSDMTLEDARRTLESLSWGEWLALVNAEKARVRWWRTLAWTAIGIVGVNVAIDLATRTVVIAVVPL